VAHRQHRYSLIDELVMLYEFEFSHKIVFSMTSIPLRGKGNLSKNARVTDLHPTTYSTIEKWSQDPILRSKGFDFTASKFPTVFGLKKSDLRTKCKSRAYHLVSKHKTETKEDIGATTTLQINKSIEKLGLGDPEDPEMAMIPVSTMQCAIVLFYLDLNYGVLLKTVSKTTFISYHIRF
jgi:hypothetical protein